MPGYPCSPCCDRECWDFEDAFNRAASYDLGPNWNQVVGSWGIRNAGTGDYCAFGGCAAPLNQLHEDATTDVGTHGTASALLIGTQPVPASSAGEMGIEVYVLDPQVGDVFYIYPCCVDEDTTGTVTCKYEFTGGVGGNEWHVSINDDEDTATDLILDICVPSQGHKAFLLGACADHRSKQVKAWGVSEATNYTWADCVDPGTGQYYGIGHGNVDHGAIFDDFYVSELRKRNTDGTWELCYICLCSCAETILPRNLVATIVLAVDRAACLEGITWPMVNDDTELIVKWEGTGTFTHFGNGTFGIDWILECDTIGIKTPEFPEIDITLKCVSGCRPGMYTYNQQGQQTPAIPWVPNHALSSCSPELQLYYGPMYTRYAYDDDLCEEMEEPSDPCATVENPRPFYMEECDGLFYILITERGCGS